jgi:regulator of ribonuclease activity A
MAINTADLCDDHDEKLQVAEPIFADFGGEIAFHGQIHTLKIHEDNTLVRDVLAQNGSGKVLVIDGGGSLRCALVGGNLAVLAAKNHWAGIVVYGCVRDSLELAEEPVGIKAMATNPRKTVKRGVGLENETVRFADVTFTPGHWLYADEDGIVVSAERLHD